MNSKEVVRVSSLTDETHPLVMTIPELAHLDRFLALYLAGAPRQGPLGPLVFATSRLRYFSSTQ